LKILRMASILVITQHGSGQWHIKMNYSAFILGLALQESIPYGPTIQGTSLCICVAFTLCNTHLEKL
jgi:hypothetical protein